MKKIISESLRKLFQKLEKDENREQINIRIKTKKSKKNMKKSLSSYFLVQDQINMILLNKIKKKNYNIVIQNKKN